MRKERILIVEDEANLREALCIALRSSYEVVEAEDGARGISAMRGIELDAVVTDLMMPDVDGIQVLREAKRVNPGIDVIIMTAYGDVRSAVAAMRIGAFDYLTKPFDVDELKMILGKALSMKRLRLEVEQLRGQLASKYEFDAIVGRSEAMMSVYDFIRRTLQSTYPVLVTGESGTGKELIARICHYNGPRRERPFVAINCSTLSAELIESELFGHVKGAFSGAVRDKEGLFEAADGGTLFLDEIGEMSANLQARLLRVLEDGEVRRVGATQNIGVDVRIVSATNRDLEDEVEQGRFRRDLFYRLNVLHVPLPPLRRRSGDVSLLAHAFLKAAGGGAKEIGPDAMRRLEAYDWPGNVRELENVVKRAALLARGEVLMPEDLPDRIQNASRDAGETSDVAFRPLDSVVSTYIERVLEATRWNVSESARILGLPRSTLRGKMKLMGLGEGRGGGG